MLTAVRQLASADFIAIVHWISDDVVEIADCDPAIVPAQCVRAPAAWGEGAHGAVFRSSAPRELVPSVIVHALPLPVAASCIVHGPMLGTGRPESSMLLIWLDASQVPESVRLNPNFLQHLLVGRRPSRRAALPATAARLDAIMANVPQGIIFVDEVRSEAIVNDAAAAFLRVPAGVVARTELAMAMQQLFPRVKNSEFIRAEATRIARDPDARIDDWTWELDDGITLRVTSVPIIEASGRGRLWAFDNVTHERALLRQLARHRLIEEKLRQVQKLEIVGQLAASIAHDFNNLLTIIGGSAEMLEDLSLDAERRNDLHNISQATERARRLTRQLLTFTRQQIEQSEAFVLDDRLRETASLLGKVLAPKATLSLVLHADSAKVFADPSQIELALLNLLANARDAMPDGGVVTLRTELEVLTGERVLGTPNPLAGNHVAISVHDTGIGFDDNTCARMFEPFFTTKPSGQGTGLGLATVLSIAQRAGGGVRCESSREKGTRFTILLPHADVRMPTVPPPLDLVAAASSAVQRILLVDDDPGPRDTMRRLLVHEGFVVDVADSGLSALEILTHRVDDLAAIVTDYMMPQMSGRELLERVRMRLPNLPALVVSGFAPDEGTAEALTRLRAGFLAKPFTGRALAAMIRHQIAIGDGVASLSARSIDPV